MITKRQMFLVTAGCVLACCKAALGQVASATILEIEVENFVTYHNDVTDYSKLATDPNRTTLAVRARNFEQSIGVADIVSVNGKPARGVMTERRWMFNRQPNRVAGQAIADVVRDDIRDRYFDILNPDGTPIGSIMTSGSGGGPPPSGAPSAITSADFTIMGGTGAFLGARGQAGGTRDPRPGNRVASMTEDPANRRNYEGGLRRFVLHLIPLARPEVVIAANGPAVVHANDFSPVTTAKPARAGELLTLFATGLGPTRPGVDPGRPFPASPPHVCNSPVEVMVNGAPAEVLYAGGYAGAVDAYQINFRLPADIRPGSASIHMTAAFVAGSEVRIAIQ